MVVSHPEPFKLRTNHPMESSTLRHAIWNGLMPSVVKNGSFPLHSSKCCLNIREFNESSIWNMQHISFDLLEVDLHIKFAICRIAPESAYM